MSADRRALRYPLEALRQRETWRLDALYAELGSASRKLVETGEQYETLCRQYRALAEAAVPSARAAIDPVVARSRLSYLGRVQTHIASAAGVLREMEASLEQLRADSGKQRVKLESLERHRQDFQRETALRIEREQSKEADRDWLARAQCRAQHTVRSVTPSPRTAPVRASGR
jgi:hypothetical protein